MRRATWRACAARHSPDNQYLRPTRILAFRRAGRLNCVPCLSAASKPKVDTSKVLMRHVWRSVQARHALENPMLAPYRAYSIPHCRQYMAT